MVFRNRLCAIFQCEEVTNFRYNGEIAKAVDLRCDEGSLVVAPFDGNLSFWRPFEGPTSCENEGVKISGFGQWQG